MQALLTPARVFQPRAHCCKRTAARSTTDADIPLSAGCVRCRRLAADQASPTCAAAVRGHVCRTVGTAEQRRMVAAEYWRAALVRLRARAVPGMFLTFAVAFLRATPPSAVRQEQTAAHSLAAITAACAESLTAVRAPPRKRAAASRQTCALARSAPGSSTTNPPFKESLRLGEPHQMTCGSLAQWARRSIGMAH